MNNKTVGLLHVFLVLGNVKQLSVCLLLILKKIFLHAGIYAPNEFKL